MAPHNDVDFDLLPGAFDVIDSNSSGFGFFYVAGIRNLFYQASTLFEVTHAYGDPAVLDVGVITGNTFAAGEMNMG